MKITDYSIMRWHSDWMGYEVGYDNINVVGLYQLSDTDVHFYIDMDTNTVLEYWSEADCD
jgi:hypothetical protein